MLVIPIWFFIGVLLTVYGAMIFGYGLYELATAQLATMVLANFTPRSGGAV